MRYVKKRRRKRQRPEERSYLALSIIVCGMLIYAVYVSSAGKWIMNNYIEPVFMQSKNTNVDNNTQADNNKQSTSQNQRTMSYDGFAMYTMQTGAYSAKENADKAAAEIQRRGGAGYVLNDGVYRVLAFGYNNEGDANTVKEQLKTAASMESSIYTVTVPKLEFKITGEDKNLETVDGAFKTYLSAKDKVGELAVKLDKGELSKEQVFNEMGAIKNELKASFESINNLAKSDEKLGKFHSLYGEIIGMFDGLKDSDVTIFSANIKNIYMQMVCKYADYVKGVMAG